MPNMGQVLVKHNAKIAKQEEVQQLSPGCNCRGGTLACPLNVVCLTEGVIYQATVTNLDDNSKETYTGLTGGTFKARYGGHLNSFKYNNPKNSSTLSTHIWNLKNENTTFEITWKIVSKSKTFNPTTKSCPLCLKEKYYIMFRPEGASLNDRREIYATCRHRLQQLLYNT